MPLSMRRDLVLPSLNPFGGLQTATSRRLGCGCGLPWRARGGASCRTCFLSRCFFGRRRPLWLREAGIPEAQAGF